MSAPRPGLVKYCAKKFDIAQNPTVTASHVGDMTELLTVGLAEVDSVDSATSFTSLLFLVSLDNPKKRDLACCTEAEVEARAINPDPEDHMHRAVELLLEHGASPTLRSAQGESAVDVARRRGHRTLLYVLERAAAVGYGGFEAERAIYRLEKRMMESECQRVMERAQVLFGQAARGSEGMVVGMWKR